MFRRLHIQMTFFSALIIGIVIFIMTTACNFIAENNTRQHRRHQRIPQIADQLEIAPIGQGLSAQSLIVELICMVGGESVLSGDITIWVALSAIGER